MMAQIRNALRFVAAVALLLWGSGPAWAVACRLDLLATVPLRWTGAAWLAPVVLDGREVPFLFDTGAERSMLFADAAKSLHVALDASVATTEGVGGVVRLPSADPKSFTLGGLELRRGVRPSDTSVAVGGRIVATAAGLLGRDYLSPYDLDIDGPRGVLGIYRAFPCLDASTLPWPVHPSPIRGTQPVRNLLLIPVEVNGQVLNAEIDSGANVSLITATGMSKLGLSDASLAGDPTRLARGIGRDQVSIRLHSFHDVTIGAQRFPDQNLWIGPVGIRPAVDMLLGADWLHGRRVWLSYATDTVFVSLRPGEREFGE